jgi:hypothetical protein
MPAPNQTPRESGSLLVPAFEATDHDLRWTAGVGYPGVLSHANTAERTYTFPDASITVPGTVVQSCGTSPAGSPGACNPSNISPTSKFVVGTVAMNAVSPSTAAITKMPAFTSATSYACTVTSQTSAGDSFRAVNVSPTAFTITGPDRSSSVVSYICIGN